MYFTKYRNVFLIFTICITVASSNSTSAGPKVHGKAISDRTLTARITLPDQVEATFAVTDGTIFTAEHELGFMYGFAPAISVGEDGDPGSVRILPLEIVADHMGEHAQQFTAGRPEGQPIGGRHQWVTPHGHFEIHTLGLKEIDGDKGSTEGLQLGKSGRGNCCVTCGAWVLCSTSAVTHSCGSCRVVAIPPPRPRSR